ncbi:hypothetical protein [Hydrogenophaga sp. Root209]|nr:hypothetical protein [Hydrogenophaga sp. Root209]
MKWQAFNGTARHGTARRGAARATTNEPRSICSTPRPNWSATRWTRLS